MTDIRTILFIDDMYCLPAMQPKLLEIFGEVINDFGLTPAFATAEDERFGHSVHAALKAVEDTQNLAVAVVDLEFGNDGKPIGSDVIGCIHESKPNVPIICFSSTNLDDPNFPKLVQHLKKAGAAEFISKKLSNSEVSERMKKVLQPFLAPKASARATRKRVKTAAAHAK